MGKGTGEHPPQKFVNDQIVCQVSIMVLMGASITLSSLSAGMDDAGTFPFPYFFTGFILGSVLFVNLISRWVVVDAVQKKGVIKNNCYFDIEGDRGEMYKSLAIGLIVVHIVSFGYLLFSNLPTHCVLKEIKEDPKPMPLARARQAPTAQAPAARATAANTAAATTSQVTKSVASPKPTNGDATNKAASDARRRDTEMKALKKQLDEREREIERRERELSQRDRLVREVYPIPPPPSYNDIINHV